MILQKRAKVNALSDEIGSQERLVDEEKEEENDKNRRQILKIAVLIVTAVFLSLVSYFFYFNNNGTFNILTTIPNSPIKVGVASSVDTTASISAPFSEAAASSLLRSEPPNKEFLGCLLKTEEEDFSQHIVRPPAGPVTLVCCQTTKGPLSIAVHKSWAPIGADNFLSMVSSRFFHSKVGLFRALKGFLVQFGLAGDPAVQKSFEKLQGGGKGGNLLDDPPWLPLGPPGREVAGISRYQKGYLGYAGAGKNSRGTQLIMAFDSNKYLGGGSPWEVPFGQLVGEASYATLGAIYTKYGEAPSQGKIRNKGVAYLELEFPLIDYITSCNVAAVDLPWRSLGVVGSEKVIPTANPTTTTTTT